MAQIIRFPGQRADTAGSGGQLRRTARAYTHRGMSNRTQRVSELGARFRLGDWLVEPSLNRISRDGVTVQLESKAMDVLVYLAGRAGEVASQAQLQDGIWQTEFVSYNTVANRISELRDALEDDARHPRYIETIPKKGYRLIAEVDLGAGERPAGGALAHVPEERADDRSPYPGLAPFSEADAADFFGRETEIAALWRKITGRRLLAVIGASGAGKSSLVRAGVVARAPPGWHAVVCQPGEDPFLAMARALAPDVTGDAAETQRLLAFQDPDIALAVAARWRGRWDEALLVVDQFEELFTLNPEPVRERFADLLRRLVDAAGIHVVLVLRDDFLLECHRHPEFAPIFNDLTPVGPPAGGELKRALTEPAARRLFGFESESMVDEMVGEVEAERGALPLLAFAVSRLWEMRDRERRLLTRTAFQHLGGVGGALARHAEATMDRIGTDRIALVRELFRNLVTAEGTRAVREWGEILSVFRAESTSRFPGDKPPGYGPPSAAVGGGLTPPQLEAEEVLRQLVDARLLTSYEVREADEAPTRRVEIVHESLLSAWPRLVRWQAQDAEGALLRDQLRQAARTWHEHDRSDDLLWSGSAYREFVVWRERYPGGLSELEEAFGSAVVELAGRRRRRRRLAVAGLIAATLAVAAVTTALWLRSARETRRAEAAKLIALGRVELERNPSATLALARASLEVEDSAEARALAVQALWAGPPTLFVTDSVQCTGAAFGAEGNRLACGGYDGTVTIFSDDGRQPLQIAGLPVFNGSRKVAFTPAGDRLFSSQSGDPNIRIFSDSGEELDSLPGEATDLLVLDDDTIATYGAFAPGETERAVRVWSLGDSASQLVARWQPPSDFRVDLPGVQPAALDSRLRWLAHGEGSAVHLLGLTDPDAGRDIEVGTHRAKVREVAFAPDGSRLASVDEEGGFRVWSVAGGDVRRSFDAPPPSRLSRLGFDASGSKLGWGSDSGALVWSLDDPPDAAPRLLRGPGTETFGAVAFDPHGRWAAAGRISSEVFLWSLDSPYPRVLQGHTQGAVELAFTADSRFLASCGFDGTRLWPLSHEDGRQHLIDLGHEYWCFGVAADASSPALLVAAPNTGAFLVQPDNVAPRQLVRVPAPGLYTGALNTRVGLAAVGVNFASESKDMALYVVDLESGDTRSFPLREGEGLNPYAGQVTSLGFAADGSLISGGDGGISRWDVATGERTRISSAALGFCNIAMSRSERSMIAVCSPGQIAGDYGSGAQASQVLVIDPATGSERRITSHGETVTAVATDATGELIATGDSSGAVRVGRATGEEPHLLLGHHEFVYCLAFSPDGRWLATASGDEIFLWPMPDLSKPPLHTLPHDELLTKLRTLTNLRAVRDPESDTGWKIEIGPFPGWREVPTW